MKVIRHAVPEKLISITCDVCGTTHRDPIEMQEFLSYRDTGGYGSKIGDGTTWEIDICQDCCQTLLGKFIRIVSTNPH